MPRTHGERKDIYPDKGLVRFPGTVTSTVSPLEPEFPDSPFFSASVELD